MRIIATQLLRKQVLEVSEHGITYSEGMGVGTAETSHHAFSEIDAVLRTTDPPVLSIQIGSKLYSIQYLHDLTHQAVIDAILAGVRASMASA